MTGAPSLTAPPDGRSGAWLEDPGFGIYVHIPFCLHRCHYCDFNTYEGANALHGPYVDALERDIWTNASGPPATSVFFGGGTPTLLAPRQLARLLAAIAGTVGLAPGAEITIEVNPETVDAAAFGALLAAGFNRFSIGVQSLAPGVLRGLGRTHSAAAALGAVAAARLAGATDINMDLIYGSPWERPEDWRVTVEGAISAEVGHVSAYALTVEEGTPLHVLVASGRVPDVDPDIQAERFDTASELFGAAGLDRYETSNWARPGRACRHNLLYWSAGEYLGFGAGAHGHVAGRRSWTVRLPRDYIAAVGRGKGTEAGCERLEVEARAGEAMMLGLRLASGVELGAFERRFGGAWLEGRSAVIDSLRASGLLDIAAGRLRIPASAAFVADEALCQLL